MQVLSRLSFVAQQMLLPVSEVITGTSKWTTGTPFEVTKAIETDRPQTDWRQYYMVTSTDRSHAAVQLDLTLGSDVKDVVSAKQSWQPKSVRAFHDASVGVWHPDHLLPCLYWNGGTYDERDDASWFSPFISIDAEILVHVFTEKLPHDDQVSSAYQQATRNICCISFQLLRSVGHAIDDGAAWLRVKHGSRQLGGGHARQ